MRCEIRLGRVIQLDEKRLKGKVKYCHGEEAESPFMNVLQRKQEITAQAVSVSYEGISKSHTHEISAKAWLPKIGDLVLCIIMDSGGNGYILGSIGA